MKRIAIVGAGQWSEMMHLPALFKTRDRRSAEYCAVCDLDRSKAEDYAAKLGCAAYSDIDAMIRAENPDGLALLASPSALPALIRKAAAASIPFLSEKPPAPNAIEHQRLIETVGGLPHLIAYNRRYSPYIRKAVEWLRGLSINYVSARFTRHRRFDADFTSTAVHAIDATRCLLGSDIKNVRIDIRKTGKTSSFFLNGVSVKGAHFDIAISPDTGAAMEHYWIHSADRAVFVSFPQPPVVDAPGKIECFEANQSIIVLTSDDFSITPDDLPSLAGITGEHDAFIELLDTGRTPESTLARSLQTQHIRDDLLSMLERGLDQKEVLYSTEV
ncbi:MAG: Gfo/Idh/MocA family oxidoreductase [Planctomycetota bacterium]